MPGLISEQRIWKTVITTVFVLICLPLLTIVTEVRFTVFHAFLNSLTATYTLNTFILLFGVGLLSVITGVLSAWLIAAYRFPLSGFFSWSLALPLAIPAYILAFVYKGIFGVYGTTHALFNAYFEIDNMPVLILLMSMSLFPYIYLSSRASFRLTSGRYNNVAGSLGSGEMRTFFRIILPLSWPAVFAGLMLVIMEVLNNYGAVKYFGVNTFTTEIIRNWNPVDHGTVHNIAILLLLIVIVVFIIESLIRKKARFTDKSSGQEVVKLKSLKGWKALIATMFCLFPVVMGFGLPVIQLCAWSIDQLNLILEPEMVEIILTTFGMGLLAALCCVFLAFMLKFIQHHAFQSSLFWLDRFATLGYAIPGALLGVGLLSVLFWLMHFTGLNLTSSLFILIFAYIVRFYAVAQGSIQAGFEKVSVSVGFSSFSLGKSWFGTMRSVHVPMLNKVMMVAGILVFVDVIKELPLTMMFQRFNFSTLAVEAFTLMEIDGTLYEAALPSLLIVVISVIPVVLVDRILK